VLVTLDTTRFDALSALGGPPGLTPNLDALAAESLVYEEARSVAPLTLPAHASIMTGLYPPRHTARGNGPMVLPPSAETVAERARAAGYETAGFVGALALDRAYGIAQGFEVWDQPDSGPSMWSGQIYERPAREVVAAARTWLTERDPARPLFLWVHVFDPHAPYQPPPEMLARAGGDPYLGEVAAVDAALGRLLDDLRRRGLLERATVVVAGDHGEARGGHGESTHGLFCYDETLRVPLFVRHPDGYRAGETERAPVSLADLGPTLLDALGLAVPPGLDGASFLRRAPAARGLYFESYEGWRAYGWSPLAGWLEDGRKYVHSSAPELYDLRADPGELVNLYESPDQVAPFRAAIESVAARPALESAAPAVDPGTEHMMQALGYAGFAAEAADRPGPLADTGLPSPRERLDELATFEAGRQALYARDLEAAVNELERVVEQNPRNVLALEALIEARIAREEWPSALELLQQRLALPPESIKTHRDLVRTLRALGRDAEAERHVVRSLELLIRSHERRGEEAEAERYRELLRQAPAELREAEPEAGG
jgi:arylsulfatase A-like enzyme